MNEAEHFREKQRQCLRLIKATSDKSAIEAMTALAAEFEAKARLAEDADDLVPYVDGAPGQHPSFNGPRDQS